MLSQVCGSKLVSVNSRDFFSLHNGTQQLHRGCKKVFLSGLLVIVLLYIGKFEM